MEEPAEPFRPRRRTVLAAAATLPVVRVATARADAPRRAAGPSYRYLTAHQAAVVVEATARLVPGPKDDPTEIGHPGAREAGVVHYIDRLLSLFHDHPPYVFTGGPWSDRHSSGPDHLADFVPLHERQERAWRLRVKQLRRKVAAAVVALDKAARSSGFDGFVAAPAPEQDRILTEQAKARNVLFELTIDAMYSVPEYGGNAGRSAWHEIDWPGDVQPRGYTAAAVESDDGPDPVAADDLPAVQEVLAALPALGRLWLRRGTHHG